MKIALIVALLFVVLSTFTKAFLVAAIAVIIGLFFVRF